jgi:hypothetical protein
VEKDYTLEEFSYILKSQSHQSDSYSDKKDFSYSSTSPQISSFHCRPFCPSTTQASSVPKFENSAASSRCEASELYEILDVRSKKEQGRARYGSTFEFP